MDPHNYTCEDCGKVKRCAIAGCPGDCAKICYPCVRLRASGGYYLTRKRGA